MPYMTEIQEEIESAIAWHKENMPDDIKTLISKTRYDLYYGPSYYDADGDECSMWDEGAKAFNFSYACDQIRDYLYAIDDLSIEEYFSDIEYNENGEEIVCEAERVESVKIDGTADQIRRALVGRELFNYVR